MAKVVIILGLFLTVLELGSCLKCYHCDSSKGITCEYGGLLSYTYDSIECSEPGSAYDSLSNLASSLSKDLLSYSCVKLSGKDKEGRTQVARTCAPYSSVLGGVACNGLAKTAQFLGGEEIEELNCYTCTTDKCNSATSVGGGIVSLFVCSIAMIMNRHV